MMSARSRNDFLERGVQEGISPGSSQEFPEGAAQDHARTSEAIFSISPQNLLARTTVCAANAREQMDPETAIHMLCEPAQSKCTRTWTSQRSHFMREFTRKMPGSRRIPRPRSTCCASLCSQMHLGIAEEPFRARIHSKKVAPQKLGAGFVRACAVDMHTDMSEKPFYARI